MLETKVGVGSCARVREFLPSGRPSASGEQVQRERRGAGRAGYRAAELAEERHQSQFARSADAFAAFEEVGLENEEAVRETGRRFRKTFLDGAMVGNKSAGPSKSQNFPCDVECSNGVIHSIDKVLTPGGYDGE